MSYPFLTTTNILNSYGVGCMGGIIWILGHVFEMSASSE